MTKQSRRKFSAEFKAKVALEAIKNDKTMVELGHQFEINPVTISKWKNEFLERMSVVFKNGTSKKSQESAPDLDQLYAQIGLGINSEIPTLLTGVGLRNNLNGSRRFTISGGLAMSWLKELETLEVGDPVSGTDDIDKDFKYSSTPSFTGYIGIQCNF